MCSRNTSHSSLSRDLYLLWKCNPLPWPSMCQCLRKQCSSGLSVPVLLTWLNAKIVLRQSKFLRSLIKVTPSVRHCYTPHSWAGCYSVALLWTLMEIRQHAASPGQQAYRNCIICGLASPRHMSVNPKNSWIQHWLTYTECHHQPLLSQSVRVSKTQMGKGWLSLFVPSPP